MYTPFARYQGAMVLMMGTKEEEIAKEPETKTVFVEDMNESELASSVRFCTFLSARASPKIKYLSLFCVLTVGSAGGST